VLNKIPEQIDSFIGECEKNWKNILNLEVNKKPFENASPQCPRNLVALE
jgi:hypothetical protein